MFKKLSGLSHSLLVFFCLSLLISSPWLGMAVQIPQGIVGVNQFHVAIGMLGLLFGLAFIGHLIQQQQWQQYFPWLVGDFSGLKQDWQKIAKAQLPMTGGRGLFSVIAGLTLITWILVALTGGLWLIANEPSQAMFWRGLHQDLAWVFVGFLGAHCLAIASHLKTFFEH